MSGDPIGDKYPVFLSTQSRLALFINRRFYNHIHWICCSPLFNGELEELKDTYIPQTCTPLEIAKSFAAIVRGKQVDTNSAKDHRDGLRRGVKAKREEEVITDKQVEEIDMLIDELDFSWYRPYLFIIPGKIVALQGNPQMTGYGQCRM